MTATLKTIWIITTMRAPSVRDHHDRDGGRQRVDGPQAGELGASDGADLPRDDEGK
jgi:hypothetical protein